MVNYNTTKFFRPNWLVIGIVAVVFVLLAGYFSSKKDASLGGVTAVGGVCTGSEDTTQLCNVNTYELETQTALTVGSTLTVSGESNLDTLVYGGDVYTTSTASNITLSAADICDNSVISVTPTAGNINVTLAATSTLAADCLPTAGDTKMFLFENGATGATSTTIVAGTGITLLSDDANGDVIAQNGWAEVQITHVRDAEFTAIIRPFTDAD